MTEKIKNSIEQAAKTNDPRLCLASKIGIALDQFSIDELYKYLKNELKYETHLRIFIEETIINHEIYLQKYNAERGKYHETKYTQYEESYI